MKKKWIYLLTALTLAVGVCGASPMISGAAELDLKNDCRMTIFPESPQKPVDKKFGDDLETNAQVVVDVYKVADAVKVPGYDAYSYELKGAYTKLTLPQGTDGDGVKHPTAEDWRALAQEAAEIALTEDGDTQLVMKTVDASKNRRALWLPNDSDNGETATGLYLLIARSHDMTEVADYKIHMGSEDGDIATIASSDQYTYIFSPELISIPMRGENGTVDVMGPSPEEENGPLPGGMTGDYTYTTSDDGEWVYDLNVYLKPIRVLRYGSLEIAKKLEVYESEEEVQQPTTGGTGQNEKVTFVFKASWTDPADSTKTETRVDSLTFDGAKEEKLYIDRIPVGVRVTVEEIYSGASYEIVGEATQEAMVEAEKIQNGIAVLDDKNAVKTIISGPMEEGQEPADPIIGLEASVAFTNTYNWDQKKGYGIKNSFTYDENGDWIWTSDPEQEGNGEVFHNPSVTRTEATP